MLGRITPEEAKKWIMDFNRFSFHQMFTEKQKDQIWKKVCAYINARGLRFEDIGFYEYKFYEIENWEK